MKKKKSKPTRVIKWQSHHAGLRLRERYNLPLKDSDYTAIKNIIKSKGAEELERTKDRGVYDVYYSNRLIRCVYDWRRNMIITFIPIVAGRYAKISLD
jgi:hypothetical protein